MVNISCQPHFHMGNRSLAFL